METNVSLRKKAIHPLPTHSLRKGYSCLKLIDVIDSLNIPSQILFLSLLCRVEFPK
jgi:hypothetical protein